MIESVNHKSHYMYDMS